MHKVSSAYKKAMNNLTRDRGYIQVGVGVITQEAQASAKVKSELAYWSTPNRLFSNDPTPDLYYGTLEQDYITTDGNMYFMPENEDGFFYENGITTSQIKGSIKIEFDNVYDMKGLTLDFGKYYPTKFTVTNSAGTVKTYTLNKNKFITLDSLGETSYLIITPVTMKGGYQRLRILSAMMGVGLSYGNDDISDANYTEFISLISEEVSFNSFNVNILDPNNVYNVDSKDSFINYLQIGQKVTISEGITLEDGSIEWIKLNSLNLESWSSVKGKLTLTAVDKFAQMDDTYTLGNKIYTRTAYEEAESILEDMGFEADEYIIDDYLQDINLTNPMPEGTHKECLQLLANACRCVCYQDYDGKIVIRSSFELVVDPEDLDVSTNGVTSWSVPSNVRFGVSVHYGDMTQNFIPTDGTFYFAPETQGVDLLDSGYVSNVIAKYDGTFETNPKLTISFPSATTYYGINVNFGGNAPKKLIIHTYNDNVAVDSVEFTGLELVNSLFYDFDMFDTMVFEFTEGTPNNRVLVDGISFGNFNDYVLSKDNCYSDIYGTKEKITKSVNIKIYTFENDEEGNPQEVEDDVWYSYTLNTQGQNVYIENPLISTETHAEDVSKWLGIYYKNNVSYSVDYRGDPRLNANDIIHIESDFANNLQTAITEHSLSFNGAFSGTLTMRKAMRDVE